MIMIKRGLGNGGDICGRKLLGATMAPLHRDGGIPGTERLHMERRHLGAAVLSLGASAAFQYSGCLPDEGGGSGEIKNKILRRRGGPKKNTKKTLLRVHHPRCLCVPSKLPGCHSGYAFDIPVKLGLSAVSAFQGNINER